MTSSDLLWYDPTMQKEIFATFLQTLALDLQAEPVRTLLGSDSVTQMMAQLVQIRERLKANFTLVVVGDFKRGKSTLVNALLGTELVTTAVTPETATINEISYGEALSVEAVLIDGSRVPLEKHHLATSRLLQHFDAVDLAPVSAHPLRPTPQRLFDVMSKRCELADIKEICFLLEGVDYENLEGTTLREKARALIDYMLRRERVPELVTICCQHRPDIRDALWSQPPPSIPSERPVTHRMRQIAHLQRKIHHLHIEAPLPLVQGIRLVDTPGLGEHGLLFDTQVRTYLHHADAVIYVISKDAPYSASEQDFLQSAILPHNFSKVFFVVNRMDDIPMREEAQALLDQIRQKLGQLFPGAPVVGLSARREYERSQGAAQLPHDLALDAAFDRFRADLNTAVLLNRDVIQLERAVTRVEHLLHERQASVERLQKSLQADFSRRDEVIHQLENRSSDLYANIEQHKQQVHTALTALQRQTRQWMEHFLERLESDALVSLEHVTEQDIQRHFYFFLTDTISTAMNACLDAQRPAFFEILTTAHTSIKANVRALSDQFAPSSEVQILVAQSTFHELTWNNLDTMHFLVDQSLISLFNFADDLLLAVVSLLSQHQRATASQRTTYYQRKLRELMPELRENMVTSLQFLYTDLANSFIHQIEATYQQEIDSLLADMRQARELQQTSVQNEVAVANAFTHLFELLRAARQTLREFKHTLSKGIGDDLPGAPAVLVPDAAPANHETEEGMV